MHESKRVHKNLERGISVRAGKRSTSSTSQQQATAVLRARFYQNLLSGERGNEIAREETAAKRDARDRETRIARRA